MNGCRHAVFKKIDETLDNGRNEVAAYELDKLLGIGMVPPTVERSVGGRPLPLQNLNRARNGTIRRSTPPGVRA